MEKSGLLRLTLQVFLRYVIASVLCLLITLSLMTLFNNTLARMLYQLMNLSVLFSLSYSVCWKKGAGDRNKYQFGKMEKDTKKGVKAGFIAMLPFAVVSALLIFAKCGLLPDSYLYIFRLLNAPFFPLDFSLLPSTMTLAEISWLQIILAALTVIIYPLTPSFAYALGFREYFLHDRFVYQGPVSGIKKGEE